MGDDVFKNYLLLVTAIFMCFTAFSKRAEANLFGFGTDFKVIKIDDIAMKGPNGESLFLGYVIEKDFFVLGYRMRDKGYVIGVNGYDDGYYPLPNEKKLKKAQSEGLIPRNLPTYTISPEYYIMGHLMWVVVFIICLWVFTKKSSPRRKRKALES